MALESKLNLLINYANLFYLNKGMTDYLQIHNLIAFSFSMLEKELHLKAYGHSGVLLLNLMNPDYENAWEPGNVQRVYRKCLLVLLAETQRAQGNIKTHDLPQTLILFSQPPALGSGSDEACLSR